MHGAIGDGRVREYLNNLDARKLVNQKGDYMNTSLLEVVNDRDVARHQKQLEHAKNLLELGDNAFEAVIKKIQAFQVAVPSWALGTGGTRFGRFPAGGEPSTLEEKIEDVGLIHHLTQAT